MSEEKKRNRRHIAVFASTLQGFYIGELVNQLRQLMYIKDYKLTVVCTGGTASFNAALSTDEFDAAIIIRDALSNKAAEYLLGLDKAVVSIAFDYFPLNIPFVSVDPSRGVDLAFEIFDEKKIEREIFFIGDLSHYDIRKRYEHYSNAMEERDYPVDEAHLLNVRNAVFSGGVEAYSELTSSKRSPKAILFGSGLTALGFFQQQKTTNKTELDITCAITFDAFSLMPVVAPELISIDANLHLIAYRAASVVDSLLEDKKVEPHILVEPKIVQVNQNPRDCYDSYIATCADLPEFHNANYVKSVIANAYDWSREIVNDDLDSIMSIAPLFAKYMDMVVLSRMKLANNGGDTIRMVRVFELGRTRMIPLEEPGSCHPARQFPNGLIEQFTKDIQYDLVCHKLIVNNGEIWGCLSFFGSQKTLAEASSFLSFGVFVELIADLYGKKIELEDLRKSTNLISFPKANCNEDMCFGEIKWSYVDNIFIWADEALEIIGYRKPFEKNIYRNVEIYDRLDVETVEAMREHIANASREEPHFSLSCFLISKSDLIMEVHLDARVTFNDQDEITVIDFILGILK